ncbi:TIGR03089 family protein [Kineococcus rubinsiae]|uniref:TIGR03089 family protein n=1 Tax=Kineococcus rubinsiae TaxID=2609562 RepID=UPI001431B78E|nr:TIGR03089 family protein [Kineococcus rubinsiae]
MSLPPGAPRSVPALLQRLVADDPGTPRLTWYAAEHASTGERIELSARVLGTWVAKTANLLEEEFDVGPGRTVGLDLPTHWRTLVLQLATWSTGAGVVLGEGLRTGATDVDVLVSATPEVLRRSASTGTDTVAVALAPLARAFGDDLPDGVLDYARTITGYGDHHSPLAQPLPTDPALVAGATTVAHADLLADALAAGAAWSVGVRLLTSAPPAAVVGSALAAWVRAGSVVLVPDLEALGQHVRDTERVTQVQPA